MTLSGFDISGTRERWGALLMAAVMVILAIILIPWSMNSNPIIPAFLPVISTLTTVSCLMTAYLLTTHWRLLQISPLAILASGYFFLGMCIIAQTLFFHGSDEGQALWGTSDQSSIWVWVIWHTIFPLYIMLYATSLWRNVHITPFFAKLIGWGTLFLIIDIFLAVTVFSEYLPKVVENDSYTLLTQSRMGLIIFLLNVLSALYLVIVTKVRTRQDLWLSIVLMAYAIDVLLSLKGVEFYSIGFYGGRLYTAIGASTLFIVFVHNVTLISRRLQEINSQLNEMAMTDPLTAIANRRHFDEQLSAFIKQSRRDNEPLTLLMIDVDHFKKYNDIYGHPAGDLCLQQIASVLRDELRRPLDLVARVGGEEFAAILPHTSPAGCKLIARRVLNRIRDIHMPHMGNAVGIVTLSVGGATIDADEPAVTKEDIIERADKALYAAKNSGRNRARFAGSEDEVV